MGASVKRVFVCDRCGKREELDDSVGAHSEWVMVGASVFGNKDVERYVLCRGCFQAVFIEGDGHEHPST